MINIILLTFFMLLPCCFGVRNIVHLGGKSVAFLDRNYTTCMKGWAILIIMLCHCSTYWGVYYTPLGGIGVAIFLILSGYGLNESYKKNGLDGFWLKRIGRMMIPYTIVIGLMTLVCGYSWVWFLRNVLCIDTYYWFIAFMMYCYVLFWFVTVMPIFCKYRICIFLLLCVPCFLYLNSEQALSFTAGILLSHYKEQIIRINEEKNRILTSVGVYLLLISMLALLVKQLPIVRESDCEMSMSVTNLILKFCGALGCIIIFRNSLYFRNSSFLMFTGVISYELYLVHYPFYTQVGTSLWAMSLLVLLSFLVAWRFQKFNNRILRLMCK